VREGTAEPLTATSRPEPAAADVASMDVDQSATAIDGQPPTEKQDDHGTRDEDDTRDDTRVDTREGEGPRHSGRAAVNQVMLLLQVNPACVDRTAVDAELSRLTAEIERRAAEHSPPLPLTLILVQEHSGVSNAAPESCPIRLLYPRSSHIEPSAAVTMAGNGAASGAEEEACTSQGKVKKSAEEALQGEALESTAEGAEAVEAEGAEAVAAAAPAAGEAAEAGGAEATLGEAGAAAAAAAAGAREAACDTHIYDHLCGLKFRLSPTSFFQTNSAGAQLLYQLAASWVGLGPPPPCPPPVLPPLLTKKQQQGQQELQEQEQQQGQEQQGQEQGQQQQRGQEQQQQQQQEQEQEQQQQARQGGQGDEKNSVLVFDVCCGTGTIGLCVAKHAKKVIGIEMNESAVEDAKRNAAINGIQHAEFIASRAELVLPKLLHKYLPQVKPASDGLPKGKEEKEGQQPGDGKEEGKEEAKEEGKKEFEFSRVVTIVDPPRAGLHPTVLRALRENPKIEQLLALRGSSCAPPSPSPFPRPPSPFPFPPFPFPFPLPPSHFPLPSSPIPLSLSPLNHYLSPAPAGASGRGGPLLASLQPSSTSTSSPRSPFTPKQEGEGGWGGATGATACFYSPSYTSSFSPLSPFSPLLHSYVSCNPSSLVSNALDLCSTPPTNLTFSSFLLSPCTLSITPSPLPRSYVSCNPSSLVSNVLDLCLCLFYLSTFSTFLHFYFFPSLPISTHSATYHATRRLLLPTSLTFAHPLPSSRSRKQEGAGGASGALQQARGPWLGSRSDLSELWLWTCFRTRSTVRWLCCWRGRGGRDGGVEQVGRCGGQRAMAGEPFQPVKAVAVDLFSHTEHCEVVMLQER
ncbi:unnamed protein product, partial [Closterium sp. NIES-53]